MPADLVVGDLAVRVEGNVEVDAAREREDRVRPPRKREGREGAMTEERCRPQLGGGQGTRGGFVEGVGEAGRSEKCTG